MAEAGDGIRQDERGDEVHREHVQLPAKIALGRVHGGAGRPEQRDDDGEGDHQPGAGSESRTQPLAAVEYQRHTRCPSSTL